MAMYDALTFRELTVLQSMLYEGTQNAFCIASLGRSDLARYNQYMPIHREIGLLFIEAGTELLERIDNEHHAQAA
jgi:hypothetical protein